MELMCKEIPDNGDGIERLILYGSGTDMSLTHYTKDKELTVSINGVTRGLRFIFTKGTALQLSNLLCQYLKGFEDD